MNRELALIARNPFDRYHSHLIIPSCDVYGGTYFKILSRSFLPGATHFRSRFVLYNTRINEQVVRVKTDTMVKRKRKGNSQGSKRARPKVQKRVSGIHVVLGERFVLMQRHQAAVANADNQRPKPNLLGLPAELRNRIYELSLAEPDEIEITKSLQEPSLPSVNRQIRSEARKIWYENNSFYVAVVGWDDDLLHRFTKHCLKIKVNPVLALEIERATKNWINLERWCKHLWDKESKGLQTDYPDMCPIEVVVSAAHQIVFQHIEGKRSWAEYAVALGNFRRVVQTLDSGWI